MINKMRKVFQAFILGIFFVSNIYAAAPTRTYTYTTGNKIYPSEVTSNEDNIYSYLQNGVDTYADNSIINADISSSAAIAASKLSLTGITTFTAGGNLDIGPYDLRASTLTADSLTATRIPFATTNGQLIDDSDLTFSTDTLTVTKIAAFSLSGKLTGGANEIEGSNFDIDGGTIDGATIGGASAGAGTFTGVTTAALTATANLDIGAYQFRADSLQIDGAASFAGNVTNTAQPAFLARPTATQTNIAPGVSVTIVFGTEIFDHANNFASNTFTAPIGGKYLFSCSISGTTFDQKSYIFYLKTSNRNYEQAYDFGKSSADIEYWTATFSILADMDAADTAYITIYEDGAGAQQTDISTESHFSGCLMF